MAMEGVIMVVATEEVMEASVVMEADMVAVMEAAVITENCLPDSHILQFFYSLNTSFFK